MPSVDGIVRFVGSQLQCLFTINQIRYIFISTDHPALPEFDTTNATFTYNSLPIPSVHKLFEGKLGVDDVSITIGESAESSMTGILKTPVSPAVKFSGVGTWDIMSEPEE